jgi:hypothetical protein
LNLKGEREELDVRMDVAYLRQRGRD